jgi:pimeloyl-ACP methyl ester carboxylesterase
VASREEAVIRTGAILALLVPVVFYAGLCIYVYERQRDMIYFPSRETASSLAEEVRLESSGEELKVWHREGISGKAVLYFGGNAENVAGNIGNFRTVFPDDSLYLMNYRGFGGSTGVPSEEAFYADAVALFDLASRSHTEISVIGRSIGSGVAAYLATVRDVRKLVLVTPFDSIENVIRERYYLLPIRLLLTEKYDTLSRVPDIDAAVLIILAENDEIVRYERSLSLVAAFPDEQLDTVILRGASHNSVATSGAYLTSLWEFLRR